MNPQDTQENYWQEGQQPTSETDYPQETYQPTVEATDESPVPPDEPTPVETPDEAPVTWTASEYIDEQKGTGWYIVFVVAVIGFIAADIFLLKSWLYTFSVLVIVMAVALVMHARRPPRTIQYTLSGQQGLYVGDRLYHIADFRAFGLIQDGDRHSIMLIPVKRFAPGVSVYFPEEAGEQIVDILGQRLPMETLKLDPIDILIRKLRL